MRRSKQKKAGAKTQMRQREGGKKDEGRKKRYVLFPSLTWVSCNTDKHKPRNSSKVTEGREKKTRKTLLNNSRVKVCRRRGGKTKACFLCSERMQIVFADVKLPLNSILGDEEEHEHRHAIEHSKETREETSRHATLTTPPRAKLENEERWQLVKRKKK